MKRLFGFLICAAVASGCAITTFEMPVADANDQVFAIRDDDRERLRAGNVLFVNRSPIWREIAVFDGYFDENQLIGIGSDGFPMLMAEPIGRFNMGPASRENCDEDQNLNRKLVRFRYPGQEYTLLVVSKYMNGGIVGPFQVVHGRVSPRPMSERYYYRSWLNPSQGIKYEIVNDVEILPNISVREYRGTNNLDITIDLNQLLQRGLHHAGQNDR